MSAEEPEFSPEAEEGGARKSFMEHLQDLRSALVRSVIAIGAALIICLFLDSTLVGILMQPLNRMHMFEKPVPTVAIRIGATTLGPYPVTREQFPDLPPGDAPHVVFQVGTTRIGQDQVVTLRLDPAAPSSDRTDIHLHNFSPAEAFFVAFHVALYGALVISSPFWIYYIGGFILPAFKRRERNIVLSWMGWSVALAATGVLLTYFVLLPVALRASVKYSELLGFSASEWRADEYVNFVCKFLFGMAIGFQFPLVVLFLVKVGILTHKQLAHFRRHVIVLSLILGALLTTPEVVTQVAMAVPLYLLYESCIWIAWYWDWKKRKNPATEVDG
jgi:sec-independent protein translocase protein TatC